MTDDELQQLFTFQALSGVQTGHIEQIRNEGLRMARLIRDHCPASQETLEAIRQLQVTVNWARTAIELHTPRTSTAA